MAVPLQTCFVIMSFSKNSNSVKVYEKGIQPAIKSLGIECVRADKDYYTSKITDRINQLIRGAFFIVADLTDERPNCFYELGFAHALGKSVFLSIREGDPIPFDVMDFQFIMYRNTADLRRKLMDRVENTMLRNKPNYDDDDLLNGKFGGSALSNGRLLMAKVTSVYADKDDGMDVCDIRIEVVSLPGSPVLKGPVWFSVHPSYTPGRFKVMAKEGCAVLELEAVAGAFTIGARLDNPATKLELDLRVIPGGPREFYAG